MLDDVGNDAGWLESKAYALASNIRAYAVIDSRKWGIGNGPDKGLAQVSEIKINKIK
jgi:hypothetical protein